MQGGCQSEQNKNDAAGQSHINIKMRVTDAFQAKPSFLLRHKDGGGLLLKKYT